MDGIPYSEYYHHSKSPAGVGNGGRKPVHKLLFLGQTLVPSGLVKTAFVVLTGILSVLCVISCVAKFVMSISELKYHLPGLRFCSTIELVAFLINAAVWAWLTFSMAQIFGLVR